MRRLLISLGVVALLGGSCGFTAGHTLTFGEGAELVSLTTLLGIDRDAVEGIMELGGEDDMDDEADTVITGLLYPDRVTDEDFAQAALFDMGDLIASDAIGKVDIDRWVDEDGYSYASITLFPIPDSLTVLEIDPDSGEIVGGDDMPWRSGLRENGAVRVESTLHQAMIPSEMIPSDEMPTGMDSMFEVDFYVEIVTPYPISETNGTVAEGDEGTVVIWEWSMGEEDILPEVLYVETEPPKGSLPSWWIVAAVALLLMAGGLMAAMWWRRRSRSDPVAA